MTRSRPDVRLELSRDQVLAFRRRVGALDQRLTWSPRSLRRAAWAGLQDSMPRAALLSLHARVEGTEPTALDDPSLVQLWGPRYSVYVVAERDRAIFSLGRLPDDPEKRRIAEELAGRIRELLDGATMTYGKAGRALGEHHNRLRYAAPTGTVLIEWDGARQPTIRSVPRPDVDPWDARLELARRYLHVFGPATPQAFAKWAGIRPKEAAAAFDALGGALTPVTTPIGDGWILTADESSFREQHPADTGVRLLPSGDAYFLLHGPDRELLVPDARRLGELWTSRVWPGALLIGGEVVGTWRRQQRILTVDPWRELTRPERELIEAEAASLPLPSDGAARLRWSDVSS